MVFNRLFDGNYQSCPWLNSVGPETCLNWLHRDKLTSKHCLQAGSWWYIFTSLDIVVCGVALCSELVGFFTGPDPILTWFVLLWASFEKRDDRNLSTFLFQGLKIYMQISTLSQGGYSSRTCPSILMIFNWSISSLIMRCGSGGSCKVGLDFNVV